MTYPDPFATPSAEATAEAPAETNTQEAPITTPTVVKSAAVGEGEGKIVLTFKEGAGFDSAWTVVHAASVPDARSILADPEFKELLDTSKQAAAYYRGGAPAAAGGGGRAQSGGGAPAAAQSAPGGETRHCAHGEMVFKSGVSKAGKPYKLFSCTAPRDQQCKAQFLN